MSQNERQCGAGFSPGLGYALDLSEVPDSTQSSSGGDGYTAAVTAWRDGGAASDASPHRQPAGSRSLLRSLAFRLGDSKVLALR